jgi:hypothetical protein
MPNLVLLYLSPLNLTQVQLDLLSQKRLIVLDIKYIMPHLTL